MPRTPGIAQGSADPCVFTRQRKKQLLPGGSTRRFFAQLRSVGSKKNQLAGLCQSTPGPWTTGPVKKPLAAAGSKKRHPLSWMPSLFEVEKLSLRELRRAASCLQAVLHETEAQFCLILRGFSSLLLFVHQFLNPRFCGLLSDFNPNLFLMCRLLC